MKAYVLTTIVGIIFAVVFVVIPIKLTEKFKMQGVYDYNRLNFIMVYNLSAVALIAVIVVILKTLGLLNS